MAWGSRASLVNDPAVAKRLPRRRLGLVAAALGLGMAFALPLGLSPYSIRILTEVCLFASLALAWNIIGGIAGYPSFGHVVFFGTGAYTVAILVSKYAWPVPFALVASVVLSAFYALLIGLAVLRLKGHYFAIATLGVAAVTQAFVAASPVFGGGQGYSVPISALSNVQFYYLFLGLAAATLIFTIIILHSSFGLALMSIREDEQAARSIGVPVVRYKIAAFVVSAIPVAVAGGLYAEWLSFVDAPSAFNNNYNLSMMAMTLLGGIGGAAGPILGAVVLHLLNVGLWSTGSEFQLAMYGVVIISAVLFLPYGIMSFIRPSETESRWKRFKRQIKENRL